MPKSDINELSKHTLHLFSGDYELLRQHYPDLGAAVVIRKLVRTHLNKLNPPIDLRSEERRVGKEC